MVISLVVIALAFTWLLYESDWMHIRLPVGVTQEPIKTVKLWQFKRNGDIGITSDGECAFYQAYSNNKNRILVFHAGITEPICGWDWILNHEHPIIKNTISITAHNCKHTITLCDNPEVDYGRVMKDVCSIAFKPNIRPRNGHKLNRKKVKLTFNPYYSIT